MGLFYNSEVKERFIDTYENEGTKDFLRHLFMKTKKTEELDFGKDIYDFSLDELSTLFYDLKPLKESSSYTYISSINSYINWAIGNGYRQNSLNPLDNRIPNYHEQFVDRSVKLYFTKDEIEDICKQLENAQDEVIVRLIFEVGIGRGAEQLLNLTKYDIDWENNRIKLKNKNDEKDEVEVSYECIVAIRRAIEEKEYVKRNGLSNARNPVLSLVDNEYVIKSATTRTKNHGKADRFTIYRRLAMISEIFGYKYFSAKNIEFSGMLYMAKKLYDKYGKLENEQLDEILGHYRVKKVHGSRGIKYYSYSRFRNVLNIEMIKELYDE